MFQKRSSSDTAQIDYPNMAVSLGVASSTSATARWSEVRKKLSLPKKPTGAANGEPSTPKTRTPRKPKDANATPTKKTQKTPARVEDEVEGDEDADELALPSTTAPVEKHDGKIDSLEPCPLFSLLGFVHYSLSSRT